MRYIELDSATEKSLAPHRHQAWLIYSQNERGLVSLRCIATEPWIVKRYVRAIRQFPDVVRVWTEKTVTNHLFAEMFMEQNYPTPGLLQQTGFDKTR